MQKHFSSRKTLCLREEGLQRSRQTGEANCLQGERRCKITSPLSSHAYAPAAGERGRGTTTEGGNSGCRTEGAGEAVVELLPDRRGWAGQRLFFLPHGELAARITTPSSSSPATYSSQPELLPLRRIPRRCSCGAGPSSSPAGLGRYSSPPRGRAPSAAQGRPRGAGCYGGGQQARRCEIRRPSPLRSSSLFASPAAAPHLDPSATELDVVAKQLECRGGARPALEELKFGACRDQFGGGGAQMAGLEGARRPSSSPFPTHAPARMGCRRGARRYSSPPREGGHQARWRENANAFGLLETSRGGRCAKHCVCKANSDLPL
jgi:hypothetical protein